ncbi:minor tail protein [Mycobacterium phage Blinn1]|uniref:Minor tail protein n=1 Tax=Mycobacterium phage Blinn1 TaxID=2656562 RepID=A0A649VQR6_9CAUD|nr:minor tail protein [Mycobacterium phage Blinn1]QGJ94796.1 minor tail protein [Mycobacterium phage Blinn1]
MTYPTDPLHAIGSDGAFEIGGGDFGFGQNYTEELVKGLFQVPLANPLNAVEVLTKQLSRLPLDVLKAFKDMIPGTIDDDFIDIATSVGTIIANLASLPIGLLSGDFDAWVTNTFNVVKTELKQILEILGGLVVTPINDAVQAVKDWWNALTGKTQHLNSSGKLDAANLVGQVSKDAVEGLENLVEDVSDGFKSIWNGWFGNSGGTGSAAEVQQTMEAIKNAVAGGYTIYTFTTSDPAWVIPPEASFATGIVIGGAGRGDTGGFGRGNQIGGFGGSSGGYLAQDLDLTGLTPGGDTLAITVGAGATTPGADGQRSSIVASTGTLLQSIPNVNGISDLRGYIGTTSAPGRGGKGGDANTNAGTVTPAENGESGNAVGGIGGTSTASPGTGGRGGDGGDGDVASPVKFGGAGGGGGGSRINTSGLQSSTGGRGGDGGYPGGGSGGGGAVSGPSTSASLIPGQAGTAPPGLVVILVK